MGTQDFFPPGQRPTSRLYPLTARKIRYVEEFKRLQAVHTTTLVNKYTETENYASGWRTSSPFRLN